MMRKCLIIGLLAVLGAVGMMWRHRSPAEKGASSLAATPAAQPEQSRSSVVGSNGPQMQAASVQPTRPTSKEMDPAVNPYAAALREPGKSRRAWDANFIERFQQAKAGDPVRYELTQGVMAEGEVKLVQIVEGKVKYVSGVLTAPEAGKWFFLTPPAGGKAGKAVGVVEFPASKSAYRIEPTGPNGEPELWQRRLDEVMCLDMPQAVPMAAQASTNQTENAPPLRPDMVPDFVPSYNVDTAGNAIISLQSYPGSPAVLLLNFFGGYTPSWGGVTYAPPQVSNATIRDIWKRVAEDYMPFNINVTTDIKVYQAAPAASRQMCCFTTTPITAAGVAYEGSWNWGNDTPCWSVYYVGKPAAEVAAHEPGHTLNLGHDGQEIPNGTNGTTHNEYYGGQGSGTTSWGPIMGAGYGPNVTSFSKGEYLYANNQQDQLNIIVTANNNVTYRGDDTGSTLATSRYLELYTNNTAFAEGVIEHTEDTDAFQFTTTGGTVSLTASAVGDWADLALAATLADATDAIIASNSPQTVLSASITTTLPAGTYTFRVTGAGRNSPLTDGFSSYSSMGYYSITGTVAGVRMPTRLSVPEHAPNSTVVGPVPANNSNGSPLVYAITSGNTGGTFSVDSSGVVRVANNTLLDYYRLAINTMYAVQFELFLNITNVNNPALTELNRRVVISVQQLYPSVPGQLTATANSGLRISLAWADVLGATGYNVKRSLIPGGPYTIVASTANSSYTDGGLTDGLRYYYVVTAVNANGESGASPEASAVAQAVADFGFEDPSIGSGGISYNPSGSFWTFSGSSGNGSGLVGNGSGFNNPTAPEGSQAAFVQSYGVISQVLSGFTPGATYTVIYAAAQRSGPSQHGGESWNVAIDNVVIQSNNPGGASYADYTATFVATAATHRLSFVGTDLAGGDNTVFIDNVRVGIALATLTNGSFEAPSIGTGNYRYNPSGASWTFSGTSPSGSGIVANGSAFGNPNAPDGGQAAFVQEFGAISRTLSGFTPGTTYTVNYAAAQRSGGNQHGGESWNVKIDNTVIQSNSPGATTYTAYTASFVATASTHTLSFVGTDLAGDDNTVFIDSVSIIASLKPVLPAVSLTLPTNNAVFYTPAPIPLAASVTTNGNQINRVEFYYSYPGILIGGATKAPYTYAWANTVGRGRYVSVFARTIFNDNSSVDSAPVTFADLNPHVDLGFESPSVGSGNFLYNPDGGCWTFNGQSGIAANGSAFGNPSAPEGSQAALLQSYGSFSQLLSGFVPGSNYTLTYSAAQRSGSAQNGGETWNVLIDSTVVQSNRPGGTTYSTYSTTFTATAAVHTLSFVGTDLNGGDNTVFIDKLSINPPITPAEVRLMPTLTQDTLPATATTVVGDSITFTAAFSNAPAANYQWQCISGGVLTEIPGATNLSLTLNNLQLASSGLYQLRAINATNSLGVAFSTPSPLTVSSLPAPVSNVVTAFAAQTGLGSAMTSFVPTWTVAPGSLIGGLSPSSVGSGNFSQNGAGGVAVLTDGSVGSFKYVPGSGGSSSEVTCGSSAGQSVTYTLPNSATGYVLSNIVVYGGWGDAGRDQQAYTIYYSTVAAPTNFIPLSVVNSNPVNTEGMQSATRASLTAASGRLATNVAAVKFDFTSPDGENGYCGYSEIAVYGVPQSPAVATNVLPVTAADVVGSQVTFTAGIIGLSPMSYQWRKISGGATNNIPGATNQTLTLANLQLADAASYQLWASNAYGVAVAAPGALTVSSVPAAVNNVVTCMAAQTGLGNGTTFTPTWTVTTNNSLIAGQSPSSSSGNFTLEIPGRSVTSLTAGGSGSLKVINGTSGTTASTNYVTCGNGNGAGASLFYTLTGSSSGYNLTNLTVYGGWADRGRDQQAYTVYYSTVASPSVFLQLGSVNYNPANAANAQSATRATLTAASGVLASRVAAVKFDFTTPASEYGYCGYWQISLSGVAAPQPVRWAWSSGNWDTSTLNWRLLTSSSLVPYIENNLAAFDDNASGASPITVTLTGNRSPSVLTNNSSKNYILAGNFAITGGSLVKDGSSTLLLDNAGPNTFSGVLLNNGTLQVGNNDTNGSLGFANVTNNAALAFNRTDTVTFGNLISGSGSLFQNGSGTLVLSAANTYRGATAVNAGTLALVEPGSVSASALLAVANGATLDVTGRADQTLTLNSGQALKGSGSVNGNLNAQSGSLLNPGDAIGAFKVQGNVSLNGSLVLELNRTNGPSCDQLASIAGAIAGGGILTVTNLGPDLVPGDSFQLFNQPVGGFAKLNLPLLGPGCGWANNLANNGTVAVVSTGSPNLTFSTTGSKVLTVTWPVNCTGWRLQVQTNSPGQGLSPNWWDLAGSPATNQMSFPVSTTNGSVFYRLVFP